MIKKVNKRTKKKLCEFGLISFVDPFVLHLKCTRLPTTLRYCTEHAHEDYSQLAVIMRDGVRRVRHLQVGWMVTTRRLVRCNAFTEVFCRQHCGVRGSLFSIVMFSQHTAGVN